ncbi:uncharacterized protein LOC135810879 [Sycon ciliatum]|uniref:uncharacterized protein LOC135810879 n=1 Tax=Sycon ciliatum TaxID=27933 RepID=UPI0020A93970|eukprot:scpid76493/ scgid25325/ Acyl-protein thioesterase 1
MRPRRRPVTRPKQRTAQAKKSQQTGDDGDGVVNLDDPEAVAAAYEEYRKALISQQLYPGGAPIVVEATRRKHSATLIFLHGIFNAVEEWKRLLTVTRARPGHIRIVILQAPKITARWYMGPKDPSWFKVKDYGKGKTPVEDEASLKEAATLMHGVIGEESARVPLSRIVLAGFGQGAALALYAGLSYTNTLAGILALSGWLPFADKIGSWCSAESHGTPILQCHGGKDDVIPPDKGKLSYDALIANCPGSANHLELRIYPDVGHHLSLFELHDIRQWLEKRIPVALPHTRTRKATHTRASRP